MNRQTGRIGCMVLGLSIGLAGPAAAQFINPGRVLFTVSAEHNVVVAGTPVVDHYELVATVVPGGSVAFTKILDKASMAPDPQGEVNIVVPEFIPLASGEYTGVVKAVGPGGEGVTAPVPFGVIGPPSPPPGGHRYGVGSP